MDTAGLQADMVPRAEFVFMPTLVVLLTKPIYSNTMWGDVLLAFPSFLKHIK